MSDKKKSVDKVVLAYSGGLDTSVILKWLQTEYDCEVVTYTADLGQGEELGPARDKALQLGIKPENIFIDDVREEFVGDFVFPMFRANALYEGVYLLGTSIARPLIAKRQIDIANQVGAADDPTFGSDQNHITLISETTVETWPRMLKTELADKLAERIAMEFLS